MGWDPNCLVQGPNLITAGFLYRAGAETPLNFREKFEFFAERFWKISQGWIPNAVALNAVGRRKTQKWTQKQRKHKSAKERRWAQKGAKERKRALPCKIIQTTRFERTRFGNSQFLEGPFGGFRIHGAQKRSSCRAIEGTQNTQTLSRLLRNLSGCQKVLRRPVRGLAYTGYTETLSN